MGQNSSSQLRENLNQLHVEIMKHGGADLDIATTTTLSYDQFLEYITNLNTICRKYEDHQKNVLVFAVKKGSDSSIFWKATVRIAVVKMNTSNNKVQSYRFLNIRQFLQLFRRITHEYGIINSSSSTNEQAVFCPTMAASLLLGKGQHDLPVGGLSTTALGGGAVGGQSGKVEKLDECIICLERSPNVILPCTHAYCLPCIEQWWEYSGGVGDECNSDYVFAVNVVDKTCPVCRECLQSTDDTWVISEAPDSKQMNEEIQKVLIGLAVARDSDEDSE